MFVYIYAESQEQLNLFGTEAIEKGHAVVGTLFSSGYREEIVSVCDNLIIGARIPGKETSQIVSFANKIKLPVTWNTVPELHITEVKNPIQAKAFRVLIGQMYRTHLKKNADYSSANILGTGDIGLVTRLWDKMARIMNLVGFNITISKSSFGMPKEAKNEAIEDTFMDMAVYAVIGLLHRAGKWGR